jgi:hypothetical protein
MKRENTREALASIPLALLSVSLLAGCGDDTVRIMPSGPAGADVPGTTEDLAEPSSTGAEDNADTPADVEPVFVVFSTIDTPDGRNGYFVTTSSLDGGAPIDVRTGIEVPGGGQMYAPDKGGYVLVGDGESPEFTRYALDAAGNLQRGPTISFANLGVTDVWRHMIFVDESKAYFLDMSERQIVSFNPSTMVLNRAIPVPDFQCEGETQTEFGEPIQRADGYYFTRSCWDLEVTSLGASLVPLDPETDEVTVTHDQRCMGMQVGFLADNGDAYWFSDHDASVEWSLKPGAGPHDCALRLRAGETTFDADWELDLTTLTGGASAVASVPAGGTRLWVKVFDPSAVPVSLPLATMDWSLSSLPTWRWGLLDVASSAPVQLDTSSELTVYFGPPILVDGRRFSPSTTYSDLGDETTLVELAPGGIAGRTRVAGELRKVFRVR